MTGKEEPKKKDKQEQKRPKVAICIPTYRQVDTDVINSIINEVDYSNVDTKILFTKNLSVANARNEFVEMCQERLKPDYIFFNDADTIPPSNVLQRLIKDNKDIVSGLYFRRKWPYPPLIMVKHPTVKDRYNFLAEYPRNALLECDSIGMGCCLIKMDVFDKIEYPWFVQSGRNTEDIYFCKLAKSKGLEIWVDTGVIAKHIDDIYIDEDTFMQAKRDIMMFQKAEKNDITLAELPYMLGKKKAK